MRFQHNTNKPPLKTTQQLVISLLFYVMPLTKYSFDTNVEQPVDNPDNDVDIMRDITTQVDTKNPADMRVPTNMSIQDIKKPVDIEVDTNIDTSMDMPPNPIHMCDKKLINTHTNNTHYNKYDNTCDSFYSTCNQKIYECYTPYNTCGPNNTCTLKSANPKNYRTCGNTCNASEIYYNNIYNCYPGFKSCDSKYVDIDSDPLHYDNYDVKCDDNTCNGSDYRNNDNYTFSN